MYCRAILFCSFLFAFTATSAAQQPNGRIDLDTKSGLFTPGIVTARVSFVESDGICTEKRGALRIANGILYEVTSAPLVSTPPTDTPIVPAPPTDTWRVTQVDNQTWDFRITMSDCQMGIGIRQLVRHEGTWTPLLVPSDASRSEIQRLRAYEQPRPPTVVAKESIGSLRQSTTLSLSFFFENSPETCFEAVGDYRIERTGITFAFLVPLPGDLNRFVIERTDLDEYHSRLSFTRDDCRWELTLGQSVRRNGQWIALPLAPIPLSKG
jgi:hypothetical protein